jgi:hypothetical protein
LGVLWVLAFEFLTQGNDLVGFVQFFTGLKTRNVGVFDYFSTSTTTTSSLEEGINSKGKYYCAR